MTTNHTPNYTAARTYAHTLSADGRRYASALIDYYLACFNGLRPRDPEAFRPKSPIVHTKVANMIRHLLVGDCDERGTAIERPALAAAPVPVEIASTAAPVVSGTCARCGWPLDTHGRCLTDLRHTVAVLA